MGVEESSEMKEEESTQLEVETKKYCVDSVEASNKVEPSKEELPQKERISSSLSSSTLPPPPPRPQQEADGSKSGEMSAMPLPPPPPGAAQRPPGVPQPPRPPGIETMPWVPLPPSGRTQPLPPPAIPPSGHAQFSGLLPGAFGNAILANGLSVATGGGPEVLEVWRDYFKLYREYVGKLVSEADHANPLYSERSWWCAIGEGVRASLDWKLPTRLPLHRSALCGSKFQGARPRFQEKVMSLCRSVPHAEVLVLSPT